MKQVFSRLINHFCDHWRYEILWGVAFWATQMLALQIPFISAAISSAFAVGLIFLRVKKFEQGGQKKWKDYLSAWIFCLIAPVIYGIASGLGQVHFGFNPQSMLMLVFVIFAGLIIDIVTLFLGSATDSLDATIKKMKGQFGPLIAFKIFLLPLGVLLWLPYGVGWVILAPIYFTTLASVSRSRQSL